MPPRLLYILFHRHRHSTAMEFLYNSDSSKPFECFIVKYFQYQLRNRSVPNDVDPLLPEYRTDLQKVFSSYLTIASLVPVTLANFANLMLKEWLVKLRVLMLEACQFFLD